MMHRPPKGLAAALKKPVEDDDEDTEAGDLDSAAEDLISAVEAGDPSGVASAFKAMHVICGASEG